MWRLPSKRPLATGQFRDREDEVIEPLVVAGRMVIKKTSSGSCDDQGGARVKRGNIESHGLVDFDSHFLRGRK